MWVNGVPITFSTPNNRIVAVIVWKDFNCDKWSYIGDGDRSTASTFSQAQKDIITEETAKMIEE